MAETDNGHSGEMKSLHKQSRGDLENASKSSLQAWRARFLSNYLAGSSQLSHNDTDALHSYIHFCNLHGFPLEPTADTLSFYLTFASFLFEPQTLSCYLSRICSQLELYIPSCRAARQSYLVTRTLAGIKRHHESRC